MSTKLKTFNSNFVKHKKKTFFQLFVEEEEEEEINRDREKDRFTNHLKKDKNIL